MQRCSNSRLRFLIATRQRCRAAVCSLGCTVGYLAATWTIPFALYSYENGPGAQESGRLPIFYNVYASEIYTSRYEKFDNAYTDYAGVHHGMGWHYGFWEGPLLISAASVIFSSLIGFCIASIVIRRQIYPDNAVLSSPIQIVTKRFQQQGHPQQLRLTLRDTALCIVLSYIFTWLGIVSVVALQSARHKISKIYWLDWIESFSLSRLPYPDSVYPHTVFGEFGYVDGAVVICATCATCFLVAFCPAHRRIRRSRYIAKRLCRRCGYPRPAGAVCPECGTVPDLARQT
jgi:hypothetical protein